ncbi:D-glycero-D-manno-heptose 7-phosphate kinase [Treponema primitia ZAS-2]|uniref:D-glycero-D-manno-heptose 7-phosphate kinase n=1 Tax=Treponema primitia (strain ATCC BAA-887 / DSM 12427 / ZAS-2) TaxID=545694 RepID=F5YHI3_TREPZ|nr:dehydrogenase [Treponema primitia]AEF84934.1 D-glycero-D-manno-heptose 7-phosphate kinase [Treponema primitia ZAS-2]
MVIRSKAPLRLGFAGGGTDIDTYYNIYDGYVLNATIDMYSYCILEPTNNDKVIFNATDIEKQQEYEASSVLDISQALPLHSGIYNRIIADYNNGKPLSFVMTTYSDAPAGSGLGSSSTLVVAILKAYTEWLNLPLGEYDIASLAYKIEREDLHMAGGKQDQYAATFGGFNFMEFYRDEKVIVNPLRLKRWIRNELEASLVLYYTGVSRESANIIKRQIENTQNKNMKSIEGMHEMKKQAVLMKEFLLKGDFGGFSKCLLQGWLAKKNLADSISNSFLDGLFQYAMENGAESAKISGAGGGGFMMLYCNPCNRINLIKALKQKEGTVFPASFTEIGTQAWTIYNN